LNNNMGILYISNAAIESALQYRCGYNSFLIPA